jgi:hypothetical protein
VAFWAVLAQRIEMPTLVSAGAGSVDDLNDAEWASLRRALGNQRMIGMRRARAVPCRLRVAGAAATSTCRHRYPATSNTGTSKGPSVPLRSTSSPARPPARLTGVGVSHLRRTVRLTGTWEGSVAVLALAAGALLEFM